MSKEEISDEELEEMLEKDLKTNEAKRDNCGTAMPPNREIGIQRHNVKLKDKK